MAPYDDASASTSAPRQEPAVAAAAGAPRRYSRASSDNDSDDDYNGIVDDVERDHVDARRGDSRWALLRATSHEWASTASVHGVPHAAEASSLFSSLVWTLILFCCLCAFIFLFTSTTMQYLAFDKMVNLNLGTDATRFPSITFCNVNPFKLSRIQTVPELEALLEVYRSSGSGQ